MILHIHFVQTLVVEEVLGGALLGRGFLLDALLAGRVWLLLGGGSVGDGPEILGFLVVEGDGGILAKAM